MTKLSHQQAPAPVDNADLVTKAYGDANYLGGGAGLAGTGAYLYAVMSTDYTATLVVGDPVPFDTESEQRGDLSINSSGRVSGLKAGRTYFICQQVRPDDGRVSFELYNVTGATVIGSGSQVSDLGPSASVINYVFTPSVDTQIETRILNYDLNSRNLVAAFSFFSVVEIVAAQTFGSADFIHATLSVEQTNPTTGDAVDFDTILAQKSGGQLTLDTVTNVGRFSGLKAARTYVLMTELRGNDTVAAAIQGQWYNVTGSANLGNNLIAYAPNYNANITSVPVAVAFLTPTVDTEVEVRLTVSGTVDVVVTSWAAIYELAGPQIGATDETLVSTIRAGDVASHDSATPKVVSQFAFDPSEYSLTGATRSLVFRAVAANGGGIAQTKARLYSVTDTEYIGSGVTFTSSSPAKQQETLTIGSGAGQVDDSEKIYEVHIWCVSPDEIDDTIELGSAELRMINTIS